MCLVFQVGAVLNDGKEKESIGFCWLSVFTFHIGPPPWPAFPLSSSCKSLSLPLDYTSNASRGIKVTILLLQSTFFSRLTWDPSPNMREEMVGRWVWENEKENIPFFKATLLYISFYLADVVCTYYRHVLIVPNFNIWEVLLWQKIWIFCLLFKCCHLIISFIAS